MLNLSKIGKLLGLLVGVAVANIVVLSPGLMGVDISGGSALEAAAGVTLLVMSLLVILYGSYLFLFKPPAAPQVSGLNTHEDYIAALSYYRKVKVLRNDVSLALDQLERIRKKKDALLEVLGQRFDPNELSYKKFYSVIGQVEKRLYLNISGILNKLAVFDPSEFSRFASRSASASFSDKLIREKNALYKEYMAHVTGYLGANEEMLLKLDKLLLEISLLNSATYQDVEELPCMKEIDALIKQTKYYNH